MKKEPTLDYVLYRIETSGLSLYRIANDSGVPISTVQRIANRETANPRIQSVRALYDYFTSHNEQIA